MTKHYSERTSRKRWSLPTCKLFTEVNVHFYTYSYSNSKIIYSCPTLLLLLAKAAQIVSLKICKNKTKKSAHKSKTKTLAKPLQGFSEPGTIYITKFNNYEKLECSCFIIRAKPRIKHRIISRWCPFLYRFFNSTLFLKAFVLWTQSRDNSTQESRSWIKIHMLHLLRLPAIRKTAKKNKTCESLFYKQPNQWLEKNIVQLPKWPNSL